jgi:hypothetical protein
MILVRNADSWAGVQCPSKWLTAWEYGDGLDGASLVVLAVLPALQAVKLTVTANRPAITNPAMFFICAPSSLCPF